MNVCLQRSYKEVHTVDGKNEKHRRMTEIQEDKIKYERKQKKNNCERAGNLADQNQVRAQ